MDIWTIWLIIAGTFAFLEIITTGFFVIWIGIAALLPMAYSIFFPEQYVTQVIIWAITSVILILLTKKLSDKIRPTSTPTNVYSVLGKRATVTQTINNDKAQGQVKVDGDIWSARADEIDNIIPEGSVVEILRIEGVKVIVKNITEPITNVNFKK